MVTEQFCNFHALKQFENHCHKQEITPCLTYSLLSYVRWEQYYASPVTLTSMHPAELSDLQARIISQVYQVKVSSGIDFTS